MELQRKYGFWTGIAMVVGIVIGSGIFFKADDILIKSNGSVLIGVLAFLIGGAAMLFGGLVFGEIAKSQSDSNGLIDFTRESLGSTVGPIVASFLSWFQAVLLYPIYVGVLGWVAANYIAILGDFDTSWLYYLGTGTVVVVVMFVVNVISPIIAGYFQISATVVKLIPLAIVAVIGTIVGLSNGTTVDSFTAPLVDSGVSSFAALIATLTSIAFVYEGWIMVTNLTKELDSEKTLSKVLIVGPIAIIAIYVLYFVGLVSVIPVADFLSLGDVATINAFKELLGNAGGTILNVFIVVSVLGALNGVIMAGAKSFYLMGERGEGIFPSKTTYILEKSNFPLVSGLITLGLGLVFLVAWCLNFHTSDTFANWYYFDESAITPLYILYVFIYVIFMVVRDDLSFVKRFVFPVLALGGASLIILSGLTVDGRVLKDVILWSVVLLSYVPIYVINKSYS